MKKIISILLIFTLIFSLATVSASADDSLSESQTSNTNEEKAEELHTLGLFKGRSETEYAPALEDPSNREEGIVMMLRLLGLEDDALSSITDAQVNALLADYEDMDDISDWAKPYIAYAIDLGLVKGVLENGKLYIAPKTELVGNAYATMLMRAMGYAPNYHQATQELSDINGLDENQADDLANKGLNRGEIAGMSHSGLNAEFPDGSNLVGNLVKNGTLEASTIKKGSSLEPKLPSSSKLFGNQKQEEESTETPAQEEETPSPSTGGSSGGSSKKTLSLESVVVTLSNDETMEKELSDSTKASFDVSDLDGSLGVSTFEINGTSGMELMVTSVIINGQETDVSVFNKTVSCDGPFTVKDLSSSLISISSLDEARAKYGDALVVKGTLKKSGYTSESVTLEIQLSDD